MSDDLYKLKFLKLGGGKQLVQMLSREDGNDDERFELYIDFLLDLLCDENEMPIEENVNILKL